MTPKKLATIIINHVLLLTYQWYQCAIKARNDDIKELYSEKVRRIKIHDFMLWKDLVYNKVVDTTMQEAPKMFGDN